MRKMNLKLLSMVILLTFSTVFMAGCTSNGTQKAGNMSTKTISQNTPVETVTFPLKNPIKLKYWIPMSVNISRTAKSFDETELYQELTKRTNITFEFIHPSLGDEGAFNLMVASGEIPDIIEYNYSKYKGGVTGALSDNLIIPLNDVIDKYMPNYKKMIKEYSDIDINTKSGEGQYMTLPFLLPKDKPIVNLGPVARKDLLEKAGVKSPETIDEWYDMLKALKNKTDVKWPIYVGLQFNSIKLTGGISSFIGAWGIQYDYFNDNGKVKYGPAQSQYKDFLTTVTKWYSEGLIDKEFAAVTTNKIGEDKSFGGQWGVWWGYVGAIEKMLTEGKKINPQYDITALKSPVLKKGDKNRFMNRLSLVDTGRVTITTKNKYLKETAAFFDYGYSKEGSELYSLGLEGKSFKMENGKCSIMPEIFNNKYNIPMTDALYRYCRGMAGGAFMIDPRFYEAYWYLPVQHESMNEWVVGADEFLKNNPRVVGTPTAEESSKIASKETEISTYVDEMYIKFVTGKESLSNFDKYIQTLKNLGLDDVIAVKQAHHERALKK